MPAPYRRIMPGDWVRLERLINEIFGILNAETTLSDVVLNSSDLQVVVQAVSDVVVANSSNIAWLESDAKSVKSDLVVIKSDIASNDSDIVVIKSDIITHTSDITAVAAPQMQEFQINAVSLAPGLSGATHTYIGDYDVWKFTIGDDMKATFEIPHDWDDSTNISVVLYWGCDEAYVTNSGEVQWQITWSAVPPDSSEALDAPGSSDTIDYGDQDIPATAKFLTQTGNGTIAAASLAHGDLIGLTLSRVALDGGSNPVAEPFIAHIEVHFTTRKLGTPA